MITKKQLWSAPAVILGLILILISLISLPGQAQETPRIAIINSQKAFDQSAEGKKAVAILKEKEDQIKAEIKNREDELKALKDKLTEQKLTLSQEALTQLQLQIDKKEADRQKYEQESSRDFEQFKSQLIKKIRDEMLSIVDQLVKERGYQLVFDLSASGLIYYTPSFDITEEVVKRYDASKNTSTGK
ncbi:MAG TPA: OmpH family outer membrane protein [Candidatus Aminicenantes bacterium]|nr:OmpH family outer membrane protein [Candidatus Aminicenantes bacterium]